MTSRWQPEHLTKIGNPADRTTPVFSAAQCQRMFSDIYIWDPWPVCLKDGTVATIAGRTIWMGLAASVALQPNERHDVARIRLFSNLDGHWHDHGWLFHTGSTPGSREWAGCASYDPETDRLEVWYTATGLEGEQQVSFVQRIFATEGILSVSEQGVSVADWTPHKELVGAGWPYQSTAQQLTGEAGFIKAFRDPSRFVDQKDGASYVLFAGSKADSQTDFDGVVGLAQDTSADGFSLLPALLEADGVNNELERPHIVQYAGLYYLFFSTQARTFHPDVSGPTGLYGFVSERMGGDWLPLNESGLVFANPPAEPFQAYSWLVMKDLSVVGFVDFPNLGGMLPVELEARGEGAEAFVGSITPRAQISLQGKRAELVPDLHSRDLP